MLVTFAFAMIGTFVVLLMSGRVSALTALILIPVAFGTAAGFGPTLGDMVLAGLRTVAPTGVMLIFAMLYFMILTDAGMFDPIARGIVRLVGGDPVKIFIGTVTLAFLVALDGDGATVYMIVLSAMLALYRRLGLSLPMVAALLLQCTGLGNMLPWGGPTARAAVAMKVEMADVFTPLVVPLLAAVVWTYLLAWWFGRAERRRLGTMTVGHADDVVPATVKPAQSWRLGVNLVMTAVLLWALVAEWLPLALLFMLAAAAALVVNYPAPAAQRERLAAHAPAILAVATLIFAAAVFTGVLNESGMAKAMAETIVQVVPDWLGPYLAFVTALISIPVTWMVSNDVFYFGMLPVLAEAAGRYGITPAEMARASLVGQPVHMLSPLVASTYLLVGMLGLDYARTQRFTVAWSACTCLVMLAAALVAGIVPLAR
jgi:CitMHS family citrate-Mg2+:H+ or citrate-Ca2+:H+ symporter